MRFPLACALVVSFSSGSLMAVDLLTHKKSAEMQAEAIQVAKTDHVGAGWCGRGVRHVLNEIGLGAGLKGANGHDWEQNLADAGWKPLRVDSPGRAPLGSVLVYSSDVRILGRNARGTAGGRYGHVEFVAKDASGGRVYVADHVRGRPGGTVLDNFTGRAWLPPQAPTREMLLRAVKATINKDVEILHSQRLEQALEYFGTRGPARADLKLEVNLLGADSEEG